MALGVKARHLTQLRLTPTVACLFWRFPFNPAQALILSVRMVFPKGNDLE